MTAVDHAELKRVAEGASEGPWSLKEGQTSYPECDDADSWAAVLTPGGHEVLTLYERYPRKGEDRSDYDDDARFIAAANPAVVLALLSEIEGLKAYAKAHEAWEAKVILEGDWSGDGVGLSAELHEGMFQLAVLRNAAMALRTQAPDSWRPDREEAARIVACHLTDAPDTACIPITITAGDLRTIYAALRPQTAESGT